MKLKNKYDEVLNLLSGGGDVSEDEILFFSSKSKECMSSLELNSISEYVRDVIKQEYTNSNCNLKINISSNIDISEVNKILKTFNTVFSEFLPFICLSQQSDSVITVELLKNKVRIKNIWKNTRGEDQIFEDLSESLAMKKKQFFKSYDELIEVNAILHRRYEQTELSVASGLVEVNNEKRNIVKDRANNEKSL